MRNRDQSVFSQMSKFIWKFRDLTVPSFGDWGETRAQLSVFCLLFWKRWRFLLCLSSWSQWVQAVTSWNTRPWAESLGITHLVGAGGGGDPILCAPFFPARYEGNKEKINTADFWSARGQDLPAYVSLYLYPGALMCLFPKVLDPVPHY